MLGLFGPGIPGDNDATNAPNASPWAAADLESGARKVGISQSEKGGTDVAEPAVQRPVRPYAPKDVLTDLLYLRKGPGYTPQRLAGRPALVGVLGGRSETPEVLRERLEIRDLLTARQRCRPPVGRLWPGSRDQRHSQPRTAARRRR